MKKPEFFQQQRTKAIEKQEALVNAAKEDGQRALTEDENTQFDNLQKEVEAADADEKRSKQYWDNKARMAAGAPAADDLGDDQKRDLSKYSFGAVAKAALTGRQLTGIEQEMHQEAEKEAAQRGVSLSGNGVPSMLMHVPSKRDMVVGTATAGGNAVATELRDHIPALRPKLKVIMAGAQLLTGLTGNVDFSKGTSNAAAAWEGETDSTAETSPTIGKVSLTPKRLAAFTDVSLQLLNQAGSISVESYIQEMLSFAIASALDTAAINGAGSGNVPEGVLNNSDIATVALGTNGDAMTWAKLVEMITSIETANADEENMSFLYTPGAKGHFMTTEKVSGYPSFLQSDPGNIMGYAAHSTNQVPSDLTKGSGTDLHAVIFGNWRSLMIGQFGLVDIVAGDHRAKEGIRELVVNSFWDTAVRHGQSFSAVKDLVV